MPDQPFDPVGNFTSLRDDLRDRLGRVVDSGVRTVTSSLFPPMDIHKTEEAVIVTTVPIDGLDATSLEVMMDGKNLNISGVTRSQADIADEAYLRRERSFGRFSRTVPIPVRVEAENATARVKNSVITITLPRVADDPSEVVEVRGTDS